MRFVIGIRDGATATISRHVIDHNLKTMLVGIEGPHGGQELANKRIHQFESIVLIAGGTGITHVSSILEESLQESYASNIRDVTLIWAVRHSGRLN